MTLMTLEEVNSKKGIDPLLGKVIFTDENEAQQWLVEQGFKLLVWQVAGPSNIWFRRQPTLLYGSYIADGLKASLEEVAGPEKCFSIEDIVTP